MTTPTSTPKYRAGVTPASARVQGVPVQFADETLIVPPLPIGALERLGAALGTFEGDPRKPEQMGTLIDAVHAALRRNYPDLTRDDVGDLLDVGNMQSAFRALMDVTGAYRKEVEQGEAPTT